MTIPKKTPPPHAASTDTWTLAGARARLSAVIECAQVRPQSITRNGMPTAAIVSAEEWARKSVRKGTLAGFLLASPLRRAELDLARVPDPLDGVDVL
ncbi:MAG: type II toxin-antitoxin system Phd/YefM family antitoxin [Hyphomicrobium sp.]